MLTLKLNILNSCGSPSPSVDVSGVTLSVPTVVNEQHCFYFIDDSVILLSVCLDTVVLVVKKFSED